MKICDSLEEFENVYASSGRAPPQLDPGLWSREVILADDDPLYIDIGATFGQEGSLLVHRVKVPSFKGDSARFLLLVGSEEFVRLEPSSAFKVQSFSLSQGGCLELNAVSDPTLLPLTMPESWNSTLFTCSFSVVKTMCKLLMYGYVAIFVMRFLLTWDKK